MHEAPFSKSTARFFPTAAVAYWLERPPRERELVGSIPGRNGLKSLKLVVVGFSLGVHDYGNSTTAGSSVSG